MRRLKVNCNKITQDLLTLCKESIGAVEKNKKKLHTSRTRVAAPTSKEPSCHQTTKTPQTLFAFHQQKHRKIWPR
jgi:hypothetical protein